MVFESPEMTSFLRGAKVVAAISTISFGAMYLVTGIPQASLRMTPNLQGTSVPTPREITEIEHRELAKKGRIVGGQESAKGQFPFMVSLRDGDKEWSWATCGGSLISPSIVFTAAHCVGKIYIADYNRHNQADDTGIQRRFLKDADIFPHEKYDHVSLDYDFALIRLPTPIKDAKVIQLNEDSEFPSSSGQKQRVIGWGRTEYQGNPSPVQKYADLDYVEQDECLRQFSGNYITDQMLCAYSEGEDSCQGDSGGPLISMNSKGDSVQVGVVSWGAGCAGGFPGVYSRVHRVIDWINENVCKGTDALAPQDCIGGVLKTLAGGSSGTGDSSNADDISETGGEAKEKERASSTGTSTCTDSKQPFPSVRGNGKKTCSYVGQSKRIRCNLYSKHCPVTCGKCNK